VNLGCASLGLGRGDPGGIIGRTKYSGVPSPPCSIHIDSPKAVLSGWPSIGSSGRRDGGPVLRGRPEDSPSGAPRPNAASPHPQNWRSHPTSEVAHMCRMGYPLRYSKVTERGNWVCSSSCWRRLSGNVGVVRGVVP